MSKYLLIDANNLCCRHAYSNAGLKNSEQKPTSVHYGFFSTLISLKQMFNDYIFLIVWDSKSIRRKTESEEGVRKDIIKTAYKANRIKEEQPQEILDMYAQLPQLKLAIHEAGLCQIKINGQEADDIIASYARLLYHDAERIVCLTSDHDYYALLNDKVSIYDGMKNKMITVDSFKEEYNIEPKAWYDIGSFSGDVSDNIPGVYGVGPVSSLKLVREHGSYKKVLEHLHSQYNSLRLQYPDIKDPVELNRLASIKTDPDKPTSKYRYPEINIDTPFTGVALALEDKKIKKIPKTDLMILLFEQRVELSYSLKKMDDNIPDLPEIVPQAKDENKIMQYLEYFEMHSLKEDIKILLT